MQKILVSDFDRTFYLNEEDLKKNITALKKWKEAGNIFVIATGRSHFDLMEDIYKYNILFDYALINHGATIIDFNDNILFNFFIADEIINLLKIDLELDKSSFLFCCSKLESRVDLNHKEITKIGIDYEESINVFDLNAKINHNHRVNSYVTGKHSLEIITKDIDKSQSIKLLANELKIDESQIYTIGDSYNDINMIKDFHGFAMENSILELKEVTKKQYSSVSNLINEILTK